MRPESRSPTVAAAWSSAFHPRSARSAEARLFTHQYVPSPHSVSLDLPCPPPKTFSEQLTSPPQAPILSRHSPCNNASHPHPKIPPTTFLTLQAFFAILSAYCTQVPMHRHPQSQITMEASPHLKPISFTLLRPPSQGLLNASNTSNSSAKTFHDTRNEPLAKQRLPSSRLPNKKILPA
jgi:hypothetical protein